MRYLIEILILIFLIILLSVNLVHAQVVVKVKTYYKPGYQAVSVEHAKAMYRVTFRRIQKDLPVRFSHSFKIISANIVANERDFVGCYRIPEFADGACCPMEYLARHWEQTDAWKEKRRVAMFIAPPVGANDYYQGRWLSGGLAMRGCWHWQPNMPIGIVNGTEVNFDGQSRRRSAIEVYRHELLHAAFNASHQENSWNVMKTFSPEYNQVEIETSGEEGLPITKETIRQAMGCIRQKRNLK